MDRLYFEGDPATDSTRRHLERVLKGPSPRTWKMALLAGGTAWGLWRLLRVVRPESRRQTSASDNSLRH